MYGMEGVWRDTFFHRGNDSSLFPPQHDPNYQLDGAIRLLVGQVSEVEAEPEYKETSVAVEFVGGGSIGQVGWPGPHVAAGASGQPSTAIQGVHGLYEGPLKGQQVVVGFIEGQIASPVVLAKYSYNPDQNPIMEGAHFLPMLNQFHGADDVVLGCYAGSYIAQRGTLPLPGAVEVYSPATIDVEAQVSYTVNSVTIEQVASGVATYEAGGVLNLKATPAVVVNSGARAVAALGDLTVTGLGPMPIQATGTALLVP